MALLEYYFVITYQLSKDNMQADALTYKDNNIVSQD